MLKLKKLFPKRNDLVLKDYKTPAKEIINESSLQFLLRPIKSEHSLVQIIWTILKFFLLQFFFKVKTQRPPVGGWLIDKKKSLINQS